MMRWSGALTAVLAVALFADASAKDSKSAGTENSKYQEQWDLRSFVHCNTEHTKNSLDATGLDITYSPVTNSLWVLAAATNVELVEFNMRGQVLRTMPIGSGDSLWTVAGKEEAPRAITWMNDYVFAIGHDEISSDSKKAQRTHITIVEAGPWRNHAKELKRISMDRVKDMAGSSVGSLSWDAEKGLLYVGQQDGMKMFTVDPVHGKTHRVLPNLHDGKHIKDVSSIFKNPDNHNVFVLTKTGQHVYQMNKDGKRIARQGTSVRGDKPVGLTFTPNGKMMYVLGGDKRLDTYTTKEGVCTYAPANPMADVPGELTHDDKGSSDHDDEEPAAAQGYYAYANLTIPGMFAADGKEMFELRKTIAMTLFGDETAVNYVFVMDDHEKLPDLGSKNRRLAADDKNDVAEVTVVVLSETVEHAQYNLAKLEEAAKSGDLKKDLHAAKLKHVRDVEMTGWEIIGADMLPKAFPAVDGSSEAKGEGAAQIKVVEASEPKKKHTAGIVFGVLFAIAAVAGAGYFVYRRHKHWQYWRKADDPKMRASDTGDNTGAPIQNSQPIV